MSRLIDLGNVSAEYSVCAEKVLFDTAEENTLILYSRNEPVISAGRFRNIGECVTEHAFEDNIRIIRRMSGGSCIFSSPDQMTYSLILTTDMERNVSFTTICNCLIRTLGSLNVRAKYKTPNDVLVNGLKISGSAQYRRNGRMLQHGTMILRNEESNIERYLVRKEGFLKTTSLHDVLGYVPDRKTLKDAFVQGFREFLGDMKEIGLSVTEEETISASCHSGRGAQLPCGR